MKKHLPTILTILFILSLLSLAIYGIKKVTNSQVGYVPTTKLEQKQKETTNQENKGYTIKDNQEKGIEVQPENTENFKVIFPTTLQESIKINLANQKLIEITQKNNQDQNKIKESEIKKTKENSKLLDIIKKQPILTIYQDKEQNQTTFYTYQGKIKKDDQWQFKHWTIFNNPQKQESIIYQLKNATILIDSNKNAKVYSNEKKDIVTQNPDFIIPAPYYLNKEGNKTELTWTYNKKDNTLSTIFSAKKEDYPIAFDPSILQTDARIAKFSGKPIDLTSSFGGGGGDECTELGEIDWGGFSYYAVMGEDGRCWLDRNLGATRVATSAVDTSSYGDLYQWGRGNDGHQIPTSGTTAITSPSLTPGHGDFITYFADHFWYTGLVVPWQGVDGINNPCPIGFRLPTQFELENFVSVGSIGSTADAYNSDLKLPTVIFRTSDGALSSEFLEGEGPGYRPPVPGCYWSSTITLMNEMSPPFVTRLDFEDEVIVDSYGVYRACSVRCIQDVNNP